MDKADCETYRFVSEMLVRREHDDVLDRAPCSRWWPPRPFASAACIEAREKISEMDRKAQWLKKCEKDPCGCSYTGL